MKTYPSYRKPYVGCMAGVHCWCGAQILNGHHCENGHLQHRARDRGHGFTLIELMIVIAIIGVLAAIAIPAYQDYTVRAQVTEGLSLASGLKAGMTESYAVRGEWPQTLSAAGFDLPPSGRYVEGVNILDGSIIVTYGREASDEITGVDTRMLALVPGIDAGGNVVWRCGRGATLESIDWQGDSAQLTTVPNRFLPANCRSE